MKPRNCLQRFILHPPLDNLTPNQRIFSTKEPKYTNLFHKLDLEKEDKKIELLKKKWLKKFPLNSRVRLLTTKKHFSKDSVDEKFTNEMYYISKIKLPILSIYSVRFIVKTKAGKNLRGNFLPYELKPIK